MEHRAMRRTYVPPSLARHERLAAVTAGAPPVVTVRRPSNVKGGCFEAPEKPTP